MDPTSAFIWIGVLIVVAALIVFSVRGWREKKWRRHGGGLGVVDEVFRPTQHEARLHQEQQVLIGDVMPEGAEPARDDQPIPDPQAGGRHRVGVVGAFDGQGTEDSWRSGDSEAFHDQDRQGDSGSFDAPDERVLADDSATHSWTDDRPNDSGWSDNSNDSGWSDSGGDSGGGDSGGGDSGSSD